LATVAVKGAPIRERNDSRQYDPLVDEWWLPNGRSAALHWLAAARARLIPPPRTSHDVLVDVGCGGGLMAPAADGYVHVGVDVTLSALRTARAQGVRALRGDAACIPLADSPAAVVVAGEILEHVRDLPAVVAELCRVLRPEGTIVVDTINATRWRGSRW
jgi:2-polyprenyl-6-hydroxyphenyl methylase/3-demethylubiquinone-9 3-methyltransferase